MILKLRVSSSRYFLCQQNGMPAPPVGPKVWLANCYFSQVSSGFFVLLRFSDAQSGRSFIHFIAVLARLLGPGGSVPSLRSRFSSSTRS